MNSTLSPKIPFILVPTQFVRVESPGLDYVTG